MSAAEAERTRETPVLVVGVGSELRRDDAAGRVVADAVAARDLPGVEVRSVHQLTPELAADLADREQVVFVDASVEAREVQVVPIAVGEAPTRLSHHLDPATLLGLAERLGWSPRTAMLVHVPAHDLGLGTRLSPPTRHAAVQAERLVVELVGGAPVSMSP